MSEITVKVKRLPASRGLDLPHKASVGASGFDLLACVEGEITIAPGEVALVPTGLRLEIPRGYEGQVRPRSGLALKSFITVLNAPGTIDSDYRGELGVILANLGRKPFAVRRGDRIAQIVFAAVCGARLVEVEDLEDSARGEGGFGHTGV